MPKTTKHLADTTDSELISSIADDALRSMRIKGTLLLRETYAQPWSIAIPDTERLATLLNTDANARVVAFHLVEFGHCAIKPEGGDEILLKAGEMAICFGGNAHWL